MQSNAASPKVDLSGRGRWFLRGARAAFSVPGLILASAFVGFAGLARGAGLTLPETIFMTAVVWALPGKVVLVGAVLSGASLPAAALAVSLSAVRLMPMVVALVPEMRAARTRRWVLYALSHFVAVTSWVLAMERLRRVPREMRTIWYFGLGSTLIVLNMIVVTVVFVVAGELSQPVSALLLMLTPMYFLTSLWGSARETAGRLAMLFGIMLGPAFHLVVPELDLVAAGLLGGLIAYALHRLRLRRREP
jgi:predicted branched-subunit amino acid permease